MRSIAGTEAHNHGRIACLGFLLLFFSFLTMAAALAQESKAYTSRKYGFAFQYPAVYELKVAVDSYFDFKKGGETLFCLRVDDRFIEMLYQMLHPGLVVYRAGEDPYRELARETERTRNFSTVMPGMRPGTGAVPTDLTAPFTVKTSKRRSPLLPGTASTAWSSTR